MHLPQLQGILDELIQHNGGLRDLGLDLEQVRPGPSERRILLD